MFTLRVRDFQSIRDASLEVHGLTVVTGPNNCGKSALARALNGVFKNPRGYRYVRDGAEKCRVDLVFNDGRSVTWEKGTRDNSYRVDGKLLERVGSGVPPQVAGLGVFPLEVAGREIWPQFAPQFTGQVFLLDEPGSVLAETLADVDRVGVLNDALRAAQSDQRQNSSDSKSLTSEVARLRAQEESYRGLDEALAFCDQGEGLAREVADVREKLSQLQALRERLREVQEAVHLLEGVRSVRVPPPSEGEALEGLLREWSWAGEAQDKLRAAQASVRALAAVRRVTLPPEEDTVRVSRSAQALATLEGLKERLEMARSTAGAASTLKKQLESVKASLPAAGNPWSEGVENLEALRKLEKGVARARGAWAELGALLVGEKEALAEATSQVEGLRSVISVCPLCGKSNAEPCLETPE